MKPLAIPPLTAAARHPSPLVARLALAALLAVAGCNGERAIDDTEVTPACTVDSDCGSVEICEVDECVAGDRDDTLEGATPIDQSAPGQGVIQTEGDIDTFVYTASEPEWVRISTVVDSAAAPLDTVVAVYSANGVLHAWMDNFPTGNVSCCDSLLHTYLPAAGEWFITVQDRTTFFDVAEQPSGATLAYTLEISNTVTSTRETDSAESPSREVEMDDGRSIWTVGVLLGEPGDKDYINVVHPYDGSPVQIYGQASSPGSSIDPRVRLYDSEGALVLDKKDLGTDGQAVYPNGLKGNYVLEVSDKLDGGDADGFTVIYVRTREPEDWAWTAEVEPNNYPDELQVLEAEPRATSGGTPYQASYIQGDLYDEADEDWFEFETLDEHYLSVQCYGGDEGALGDVSLEVLDLNDAIVYTADDAPDSTSPWLVNVGPNEAQTLRLRLFTTTFESGPAVFYRCNVFVTPFEVVE